MSNTDRDKQRKFGAFGFSLLIHGAILLALATLTLELTMPEGNVSGTIEFNAVPQGSQLETPNVAKVAQAEAPEKIKAQAPVAPKQESAAPSEPSEVPKDFLADEAPEAIPVATPAQENGEVEKQNEKEEESKEHLKAVEDALPTKAPPGPNTGQDQVDLKGQQQVSDQNFGTSQGVRSADQFLTGIPGNPQPKYPWLARLRRIEGQVMAEFKVDASGAVSDVRVTQSTNEMFNEPVLTAMKQWKFKPPVEAGLYVKPWTFRLTGDSQEAPSRLRR